MTDSLNFTQDPSRDITNFPEDYHDFKGAAVRITVYWTVDCLADGESLDNWLIMLRHADELLKKYTLSLDVIPRGMPTPVPAPKSMHAAAQDRIDRATKNLPMAIRSVGGALARHVASAAINQVHTNHVHMELAKQRGRLEFGGSINVPPEGSPTVEELQRLRNLIDPVTEENRLIVVFVPFTHSSGGFSSRFSKWLPWVLVDPRRLFAN